MRQKMRCGYFVEAYALFKELNNEAVQPTEADRSETFAYFEFVLASKKVLYKQYFYQNALDLMLAAIRLIGDIDKSERPVLSHYLCKLHENVAQAYQDAYLFQSARFSFKKAEEIMERGTLEARKSSFKLKKCNFEKRQGNYAEALRLFVQLKPEAEAPTGDKYHKLFQLRFYRDLGRLHALRQSDAEAAAAFEKAVSLLGDQGKHCLKKAKLNFYKGMSLKKCDPEGAIEAFKE